MTDRDAAFLFFCVAALLNLAVLLRLWGRAPAAAVGTADLLFPSGVQMDAFTATSRGGDLIEIGPAANCAYALLFLSRGCPKCRAAAPAAIDIAMRSVGRGVGVWIVTAERLTAADLGLSNECEHFFLDVSVTTHAMLNPRRASPAYLFIGADMTSQASGFVGDEDWLSFAAQLGVP